MQSIFSHLLDLGARGGGGLVGQGSCKRVGWEGGAPESESAEPSTSTPKPTLLSAPVQTHMEVSLQK